MSRRIISNLSASKRKLRSIESYMLSQFISRVGHRAAVFPMEAVKVQHHTYETIPCLLTSLDFNSQSPIFLL